MRRYLHLFIVNLMLALLQTSFFAEFVGGGFNPNLVLAFAFGLLFVEKDSLSLISAFMGGLILDFLGFSPVGLSSLLFVLCLELVIFIRQHVFRGWILNFLSVYLTAIVFGLFSAFPKIILVDGEFVGGIFTLVASFIFYLLLDKSAMLKKI